MEMITATEGLSLLRWYLRGIQRNIETRAASASAKLLSSFFTTMLSVALPTARINISAINGRHFFPAFKRLKLELKASNWVVDELRFEHHDFLQSAGSVFHWLGAALATIQAPQGVALDIWAGGWLHVRALLISAFGSVRKCNAFGRSLMSGDTRAVSICFARYAKFEVDAGPVLDFVNAFFYKPAEFSAWLDTAIPKYKPAYCANLVHTGLCVRLQQAEADSLLAKIDALAAATA
jgi:hypothetical protein